MIKEKYPNLIWAILLSLIFMYSGSLIGTVANIPLYLVLINTPLFFNNKDLLYLLLNLLSFAFTSLLVFFRVKIIEKRNLCSIGFHKKNYFKKYFTKI